MDQSYFSCEFGEVHSFFNSGIAAAYYVYFKIFEEVSVTSCTVGNTFTGEFFFTWAADRTWRSTSSDNNSFCIVITMITFEVFYFTFELNVNDSICNAVSTEFFYLFCHSGNQGRAGFFFQGAWIVFNLVGDNDLSAVFCSFDKECVHSCTASIRSSSQTCRACT